MKKSDRAIRISAYTATSAIGNDKHTMLEAVAAQRSGLRTLRSLDTQDWKGPEPFDTWVGQVDQLDTPLPTVWSHWDCRNNRLAWRALQSDGFIEDVKAVCTRYGRHRVAMVLGTSTSSIGQTEKAYRHRAAQGKFPPDMANRRLHSLHSLTEFVQEVLGIEGPAYTLSTACSSSAKAFCTAQRLLQLELVDAVVVGGVDSLCGSVLYGFHALQLVSADPCRPFDVDRNGINLGEAAGFALLERGTGGLQLLGYGESSDAHHMSAPHPQGKGAEAALDAALNSANMQASEIDYIHLHGTATLKNDEIEAELMRRRFGAHTLASSTKGMTGHTLGAAGILGAVFSLLALEHGWIPGTANTRQLAPFCGPQILLKPQRSELRVAASHAFAFGGSNCVLIWGKS